MSLRACALHFAQHVWGNDGMSRKNQNDDLGVVERSNYRVRVEVLGRHIAWCDPAAHAVALEGPAGGFGYSLTLRGIADKDVPAKGRRTCWSLNFGHTGSCRPCAV
jgi:hypothetical protein